MAPRHHHANTSSRRSRQGSRAINEPPAAGEGPKALFDAGVGWLHEWRMLLPEVSTLGRLMAALGHGDQASDQTRSL